MVMPPHATIRKQQPQERKQTSLAAAPPALEPIRVRSWKELSDTELISLGKAFIQKEGICGRLELSGKNSRLYRELSRRRLLDGAGLPIKRENLFSRMDDRELLSLAQKHISEEKPKGRSDFKKNHWGLYEQIRERKLLSGLGLNGKADWMGMEKRKLISHAKKLIKEEKISSITEFQEKHGGLYHAISRRNLSDSIGLSSKCVKWREMGDEEVVALAREKMEAQGITGRKQFKGAEPGHYNVLSQRKLLGKVGFSQNHVRWRDLSDQQIISRAEEFMKKTGLISPGALQKDREGERIYSALSRRKLKKKAGVKPRLVRWAKMDDEKFISVVNKYCEARKIGSFFELRENHQKVYQAILSRAKNSGEILSRIDATKRLSETKRKQALGKVGLKVARFDWGELSRAQLVKMANQYIRENEIVFAIELRKSFNALYREICRRAKSRRAAAANSRSPLWEKIDVIRKKALAQATDAALLNWASRCYSSQGILHMDGLKSRHRAKYELLSKRRLLSQTPFIFQKERIPSRQELSENARISLIAERSLILAVERGEPWEAKCAFKMFREDSGRTRALRSRGKDGKTLLVSCACKGDSAMAKVLVENGAEVDFPSSEGTTPFMAAVSSGQPRLARFLQLKGAEIDRSDDLGWTQLMWSARKGKMDQVSLLLELGADPSLRDPDGDSAAKIAREFGHEEVALKIEEKIKNRGFAKAPGGGSLGKIAALLE